MLWVNYVKWPRLPWTSSTTGRECKLFPDLISCGVPWYYNILLFRSQTTILSIRDISPIDKNKGYPSDFRKAKRMSRLPDVFGFKFRGMIFCKSNLVNSIGIRSRVDLIKTDLSSWGPLILMCSWRDAFPSGDRATFKLHVANFGDSVFWAAPLINAISLSRYYFTPFNDHTYVI
jgi:hypothetical protein